MNNVQAILSTYSKGTRIWIYKLNISNCNKTRLGLKPLPYNWSFNKKMKLIESKFMSKNTIQKNYLSYQDHLNGANLRLLL